MSDAAQKTGAIHDVGYQPYKGGRTPPARRFLVISRNVFGLAWRQRGPKFAIYSSLMVVIGASVFMSVGARVASMASRRAGVSMQDMVIFMSLSWFHFSAFLLAVMVGCATIANDLKMGAFQFYFARPVRGQDYVLGKLLGLGWLVGIPMLLGPLAVALIRLTFVDTFGQAMSASVVVPRAAAVGIIGTFAYVLPAAGIGALLEKRVPAQALYVIYAFVIEIIVHGIAHALKTPWVRALSASTDLDAISRRIFGMTADEGEPSWRLAAIALAVICALGYLAIRLRVKRAETHGLGAS